MTRQRIQLAPAWILKAAPYGDSSLLIEAFTRDQGRVGLIARGARGPKAKARGLLQAFRPLLLSWTSSGDLGALTATEPAGLELSLAGEAVFSGWYLNELLLRLLQRHDAHPAVFDAYATALVGLSAAIEPSLRIFELRLLAELGFGLDLPDDLAPAAWYRYEADRGAVPVSAAEPGAIPGSALVALRDETLVRPEDLRVARHLLRGALAPHLGTRPLASAVMLRDLRRAARDRNTDEAVVPLSAR